MRSEALKKAQNKYNLSHDSVHLRLDIGTIKAIEATGWKRSDFIRAAIKERLEREAKKQEGKR